MKKRVLSMLLCLCLLVGFMPLQTLAAESIVTGGTWGGIDWTLDADGTLTITPTDKVITDYKHGNKTELYERGQVPCGANMAWDAYYTPWTKADVKKLVIQEGVTSIGTFAFMGLDNLTGEVVIPSTVVYIGQEAIKSTKLNKITFAEGGTESLTIAQGGLNNNAYLEEVVFPADRPEIHLKAWVLNSCDSLTHLFFPANVKSINGTNNLDYKNFSSAHSAGNHSALTYYCDNLKTITFGSEAVKQLYFDWGNPITTIGTKSSYTIPKTAAFVGLTYGTSVQAVANMAKPGETVIAINNCDENIVLPFGVEFDPNGYEFTGNVVNAPADPTAQNGIVYGEKLSAVGLPDGWVWADANTVPTVGNAGYTACYTPVDTVNYDWTGIEGWNAETKRVERKVAVSVAKADITYTVPTAKSGLIYTGMAQILVTAGSATGGEMQYAIGSAEQVTGEWSTDVPTGTDIGTYYVWYKVVGDENHNDKTFDLPVTVTIAPNSYIVTYLPGINGTGPQTTDTKTQGIDLTLKGAIFTRTGYTQTGWASTDGGAQVYALGASYAADSPITLYPVWTVNEHKLTWSNGDGGEYEQTLAFGATIAVPTNDLFNDTMRKAGYTLTGWLNDEGYSVGDTMPDQELTFTAQYTAHTYTVRFDANGGSGSMADMSFTYGESQNLTANAFAKTNMYFNGWNTVADGSGTAYTNEQSVGNLTTENNGVVTLYAQWSDKEAQVITLDTSDRNATYGDGTLEARTATAAGAITYSSDDETVATVDENGVVTVLNAGEVVITATAAETTDYASGSASYKLAVSPKTLTITAEDKEAYVYSRQPELTYTVEGLVGSDVLTTVPKLTTDANMNRAGTYTITFEPLASAGDNYSINYVNGTLTVKNYPYIPQPTYDVEIADDITGGEVSASKKLAYKGDTITITVEPNAGYELTKLTVTDSRGNTVSVTKVSDSKYTFKMPGYDVEIDAVFAKIDTTCPGDSSCPMYPYTDLDTGLWYHDGIHFCIEHGLMQGVGNNKFDPNGTTTRAMIVTILWRLEGSPTRNYAMDFEDVHAEKWYTKAIRWAASEKIVEGYGNGQFGTNDAITREQMVTIMWRYAKYKGYDVSVGENTNILSYDDAFDVAEWAIPAMQWACGSGMIQGIADGNQMNLAPQGNATRAQAAAILQRYVENVAKGN